MTTRRVLVAVGLCIAALLVPSAGAHDVTCAPPAVGGDWPVFGGDLEGTRSQHNEHRLLAPVLPRWTFDANRWTHTIENEITGYPMVANGCVFVGSSRGNDASGQHRAGWVFALNADNGDVVWQKFLDGEDQGGGVYSTLAVDRGVVYAFVSRISSPYVVAFHQATGAKLWQTTVDHQIGADAVSSPVAYDGMLWVGISGTAAEGDAGDRTAFQGSSVLLATDTSHGYQPGDIIAKTYTIPPDQWTNGYAGGAQWGTIAIDRSSGFGYVGTGNPFNTKSEYATTNAVLKLDLRWSSPTFPSVVGSYKGDVEEFFPTPATQPVCREVEDVPAVFAAGLECVHLDLDFGVQPNIYTDATGRRVVAAGQKSGVVHFFDAGTMAPIDKVLLGVPSAVGGIVGSAAYDGTRLFGPHTIGGYLWSLDASTHARQWVTPVADAVHWGPPVTHANGVLWTVDLKGFLDAYDAATGIPVHHVPMSVGSDTRENPTFSWGGVTVARTMVFASIGVGLTSAGLPSTPDGFVIAFAPTGPIV